MKLPGNRVPGSKAYRAVSQGLRQLGTSAEVGTAAMAAAQRIATTANANGRGTYDASPTTVRAGWANESRSGAVVRETSRDYRDVRNRTLVNALQQNTAGR